MKRNRTKKSLLLSVMSLLLCVSMFASSTYAWFTDEVSSGVNQIIAGNLDVELYHSSKSVTTPTKVDGNTKLFDDAIDETHLWEPGAMTYEVLKVENVGTLALKYKVNFNKLGQNYVMENDANTGRSLLDSIKVAVYDGEYSNLTRSTIEADSTLIWTPLKDFNSIQESEIHLDPKGGATDSKTLTVFLYWPSDTVNVLKSGSTTEYIYGTPIVDNDYNLKNGKYASDSTATEVGKLYVNLGLTLLATQYTQEADSFNNQYDANATYPADSSQGVSTATDSATVATGGTASFVVATAPESNPTAGTVNTNVEITGLTEGDNLDLSVSTQDLAAASTNTDFTVEEDHTAVAGIDLTLTKNGTEVTFDSGVATIVTYIVPGLDPAKVTVKYNGTGTAPTLVSYDSTTGRLEFTTTHFSEYFVDYGGYFIYLPATGKAYPLSSNDLHEDVAIATYSALKAEIEDVLDVVSLMEYIGECVDWNGNPLNWKKEYTLYYVLRLDKWDSPYHLKQDYLNSGKTASDLDTLIDAYNDKYDEIFDGGIPYPHGPIGTAEGMSFGWPTDSEDNGEW